MREGRVLLLRRPSGLWAPPGGQVEPGEEPAAAALREAFEETGVQVADCAWLYTFPWLAAVPMRIHQFIAAAPRGRVRISHEHTGYRWMEPGLYAERYLHESRAVSTPRFAPWIREMRHVTGLVETWMTERG